MNRETFDTTCHRRQSLNLRVWVTFLVALKSAVAAIGTASTRAQLERAIGGARSALELSPALDICSDGFKEDDIREMREFLSDMEASIAFLERMPLGAGWEIDCNILVLGMETVIAVEAFTRPPMLHFIKEVPIDD